jgi:hypothetical protein
MRKFLVKVIYNCLVAPRRGVGLFLNDHSVCVCVCYYSVFPNGLKAHLQEIVLSRAERCGFIFNHL